MRVPPRGNLQADLIVLGEAPGAEEVQFGRPFIGASGRELSKLLSEAGIHEEQLLFTNVCPYRPKDNDIENFAKKRKTPPVGWTSFRDKYISPEMQEGIEFLKYTLQKVPAKAILALGNTALWALTGETGISSWRGSTLLSNLPDCPQLIVLPTIHPAAVLRDWPQRHIVLHDLRRVRRLRDKGWEYKPREYRLIVPRVIDFSALCSRLKTYLSILDKGPRDFACDIETSAGHISCIGFAFTPEEALTIPLMLLDSRESYWSEDQEAHLVALVREVLRHPNARVIGQNFIYDTQYIYRHWGFVPNFGGDTMIGHHAQFSNLPKSLGFLSSLHCENHVFWKEEGKEARSEEAINHDKFWRYNGKDCCSTLEAWQSIAASAKSQNLEEPFSYQQALFPAVFNMMRRGIRVDTERRRFLTKELETRLTAAEARLQTLVGYPINPRSPPQLKRFFYEELGQKPVLDRKTRSASTNEAALRQIASREPLLIPVVRNLLEIRSLSVFISTFLKAHLDTDTRMRCSFNICGTETYRFSSSENAFGSGLNLQNIPKGGEGDADDPFRFPLPNIREIFIPDPGMTFFDIDLSSADLRIVVWEADEPELKQMLADGLDPYTEIAKEFYRDPTITKKDSRRQKFKSFAHGTNYLGTPRGLAVRLGLSVAEAERTQAWYFKRFPRIKIWHEKLKAQIIHRRYIENVFGYRLNILDRVEGTVFNQCAAWIPQSTVAILINRIMLRIFKTLPDVEVLLQVHDSLAGQFPTNSDMQAKILEQAQIMLPYKDPCIIPVGIKTSERSWGDCG
jgi:DNA polymerase I-like protein with 3'-5' exonuclease and polymerase domains/uracil-DNA glycosylase